MITYENNEIIIKQDTTIKNNTYTNKNNNKKYTKKELSIPRNIIELWENMENKEIKKIYLQKHENKYIITPKEPVTTNIELTIGKRGTNKYARLKKEISIQKNNITFTLHTNTTDPTTNKKGLTIIEGLTY